eukprot:4329930-Amphidinium_carterae.1
MAIGEAHPQEFAEAIALLARDSPEHYRVWSDYSVLARTLGSHDCVHIHIGSTVSVAMGSSGGTCRSFLPIRWQCPRVEITPSFRCSVCGRFCQAFGTGGASEVGATSSEPCGTSG